jgi:hypothetical protein
VVILLLPLYISILDIVTEEQFYIKSVKMPFVVKHYN